MPDGEGQELVAFAYALMLDEMPLMVRGSLESSIQQASEYAKLLLQVGVVSARIDREAPAVATVDVYARGAEENEWKGRWVYSAETEKMTWSCDAKV